MAKLCAVARSPTLKSCQWVMTAAIKRHTRGFLAGKTGGLAMVKFLMIVPDTSQKIIQNS
jgi:hypothetical protein